MDFAATRRLYLDDAACAAEARVTAIGDREIALDRTCFYPGGGGQPADTGTLEIGGRTHEVVALRVDEAGRIWHVLADEPAPAQPGVSVKLAVDRARRAAHAGHHTLLHVLNTIALRHHGGGITGCQIGADYSRIDFTLDDFSAATVADIEGRTNAVLAAAHPIRAIAVDEADFLARDDLRRTLDVAPPVIGGKVRVIEIAGFDAQACGGTHAATTAALGRCEIFRTENKGRRNKRLYVRLHGAAA